MELRILPHLPNIRRYHRPHNRPVTPSTRPMPLGKLRSLIAAQHAQIFPGEKLALLNLVFRLQKRLSGDAFKKVFLDRAAERERHRRFLAEDDHVGEIGSAFFNGRFVGSALSEYAACWEYLQDGAHDDLGRWQREVPGIILWESVLVKGADQDTNNCNYTVWLQQRPQTLKELEGEEVHGLCASSEDVVDNVVERLSRLLRKLCGVADSVSQHHWIVLLETKVIHRKVIHRWVNLHHGRIDTVGDECRWRGPNSKATVSSVTWSESWS